MSRFSRRIPDKLADEILKVVTADEWVTFNEIDKSLQSSDQFYITNPEMLRLRVYEKLQTLVTRNKIIKEGKEYKLNN